MAENLILPLEAFVRSVGVNRATQHAFFLGAGASVSSGVPSTEECIWEWKRSIFATNNPGLEEQFSELSLSNVQSRIQKWLDRKGIYPEAGSAEEYGFYIEQCYPIEEDCRAYFRDGIRFAKPHVGYRLLARLAQGDLVRYVWTTNFDGLTARASAGFSLIPIEIGIDCQYRLKRVPSKGELFCISLHGDYRYDSLKNTPEELQTQEIELRGALIEKLRNTPLIVTGYSGRDQSVMEALKDAYTEQGTGTLYWCGYGDDEMPEHIADLIRHARTNGRQAFYVHSQGFDDLMERLALHCLDGEALQAAKNDLSRIETQQITSNASEIEFPKQWLTRDADVHASLVPYRLLEETPDLSTGDPNAGNMLIQGDNLEALKALLPFYAGQVKCIYIDPPYNTRSAFKHYDDNLEHSKWLAMMWPRLELLREMLAEDGSLWVSIDDNEAHYLKVIMDEVFEQKNFITNVVWRKNYAPKPSARHFSEDHDHILVYARNEDTWIPNPMPPTDKQNRAYRNQDNDPRGPWRPNNLTARNYYSRGTYSIRCPGGRLIEGPPAGSYWRISEEKFWEMDRDGRIWWGKDGNNVPAPKIYLNEVKQGIVPQTLWNYEDVGHTQDAKKETVKLFGSEVFGTPKPERLIQRILHIATNTGDLVLDSFLGSGTTAAVAHKMGRRYIGIEMGEHAVSHCVPRLNKVIDGEQGGISKSVGWQGGGGFRFYRLGPPMFDEEGHIRSDIRFSVLAAHVYFSETGRPWRGNSVSPFLGLYDGRAYALLYNGILEDKGNVLTRETLAVIREEITRKDADFAGPLTVYGEQSRLTLATLDRERIVFKQTPYDVKVRT